MLRKHNHIILTIVFYIFVVGLANAQQKYNFKHITINDGLSNNSINAIFKDSKGFMWFATAYGLNRYDANEIQIFKKRPNDSTSLQYNTITEIQEDANANLWLKNTLGWYTIYNSQKENFIQNANTYIAPTGINQDPDVVFIDNEKNIWMSTKQGNFFVYKLQNKKWISINKFSNGNITSITRNKENIYVAYSNGNIAEINQQTLSLVKINNLAEIFSLPTINTLKVFVDNQQNIWAYQQTAPNGILFFDNNNQQWSTITTQPGISGLSISSLIVKDIVQDNNQNIWIALDHGGINIVDTESKIVEKLTSLSTNNRSLTENSIMCLYVDKENIVWAGSYKTGISYYSPCIFKFLHIIPAPKNEEIDFDNDINSFEEDLQGNIWLASNNKGLLKIDPMSGKKEIFNKQKGHLPDNVVVSLKCDTKGRLWIGTYQGGAVVYDKGKFTQIPTKKNANDGIHLNNSGIWTIEEDNNHNIWFGTLGGGINILNPETHKVTYLTPENSKLASEYITTIKQSSNKELLIGTILGINTYNTQSNTFTSNQPLFNGNNIICTFQDSRGLIWAGTMEGLHILNPKTGETKLLNRENGIVDDAITAILEDNNKNIWASTLNGLTQIIVGINPKDGKYTFMPNNYEESDGLQSKAFNERSCLKTSNGSLLFGGTNGYNEININSMIYNNNKPKVVFTAIKIGNTIVKIDSTYSGTVVLPKTITNCDTLILNYQSNSFTIKFSAMDYIQSEKTIYSIQMSGIDKEPLLLNYSNANATYTNLSPGTYTLTANAANNDGYWSDKPTTLTIIIKPPFYKSTLAYIAYVLIIIALLIIAILAAYKIMHSKMLIEQERINAQHSRKLNEMKLRFFTNVSHEFRTQISLITIPIDKLLKNISGNDNKKTLSIMQKNANKLLQLVDQILDLRKLDVNGDRVNLSSGDIINTIQETCMDFSAMYENKHIEFTFSSFADHLTVLYDNDKIQKIVTNLLSNAYKYTPQDGKIDISIDTTKEDNKEMLKVCVSDNGKGIQQENINHIFERFFQEDNPMPDTGGSGIGLHICKEFVELHGGKIHAEPNIPQGTTFVFTIPLQSQILNNTIKPIKKYNINETPKEIESIITKATNEEQIEDNSSKKTILIVDDNDDFRVFLKDSLNPYFQVLDANDGKPAFNLAIQHTPDIIITDVMMPQTDGYKLCKMIKNDVRTSHIPIILLTARTADEQVVKGLESGADEYITKPFNFDVLLLKINKLIEQRRLIHNKINQQKEINPSEINISSLDEKLIEKALACVEKNIENNEFSVEMLAKEMGMSRVHLYKKLSSITGKTPIEFIRIIRLKRAAQYLEKSQMSVAEIAYQVGFNNPKYFSRYFKEEFGMLPSAYAQKNKQ